MATDPKPRHLLIIGAQRSGTTYLAQLLDSRRDVTLAQPARPEPKAFLSDEVLAGGRRGYLDRWFGHADGSEALLVEKSTSYLEHPDAIARVTDVLGRPLALAQLRDPLARAVSNWRFSTDNGVESWPLEDALRADLAAECGDAAERPWDRDAFSVSPYRYLRRGRYAEQLVPWRDALGDRLVVVFTEELLGSPGEVGRLCARLGLEPQATTAPGTTVNASSTQAPRVAPELEEQLRAWFRAPDEELEALLGRAVPWAGARHG
ncbi:MAG TPA: sulfotransferase [Marmoricola sp.]|nr:sulfotransferase [Marmoricola sp.]